MKQIIIVLTLLISISSYGQSNKQNISLSDAISLGLKNRYDIKANNLNVDLAKNKIQKSKKEWLPNISATGDIKYNTQLQTMIFPDVFGTGEESSIALGTTNNTLFSLDLSQTIYKPGLNLDIKIAKNDMLWEQEKNREKNLIIKQQIIEAYLNVVLKIEQLKLAKNIAERHTKYLALAEDKYKLQSLLENDLLKIKLDYENTKISAIQAQQNYDLALAQLGYQLNLKSTEKFLLTDSLTVLQNEYPFVKLNDTISRKTELKQLEFQQKKYALELKKSKQYYLPTISLVGNYSNQFQSDNYNYSQNLWSPFNYIGLKIELPITGNLKNSNTRTAYQLKLKQTEFLTKQKRKDITNKIHIYKSEIITTKNTLQKAQNNLTFTKQLLKKQLHIFHLGTITYRTVLDAEETIKKAEENYNQAVYKFLIAKVNYAKVMGMF